MATESLFTLMLSMVWALEEKLLPEHSQKELVAEQFKISLCFYLALLMTALLPCEKVGHHSVLCCP